jgi:hypothetical protein
MPDVWSLYSQKVMEHFRNPRNVGEIQNPDGVGHVGNPVCGDIMDPYIKVKDGITGQARLAQYCRRPARGWRQYTLSCRCEAGKVSRSNLKGIMRDCHAPFRCSQ